MAPGWLPHGLITPPQEGLGGPALVVGAFPFTSRWILHPPHLPNKFNLYLNDKTLIKDHLQYLSV